MHIHFNVNSTIFSNFQTRTKLNRCEGHMEDWLKYQISLLFKYRQHQNSSARLISWLNLDSMTTSLNSTNADRSMCESLIDSSSSYYYYYHIFYFIIIIIKKINIFFYNNCIVLFQGVYGYIQPLLRKPLVWPSPVQWAPRVSV